MRTVGGRTDHVVVVGAGLAGLSAALHLAGRGRAVTVVERGDVPGGTGRPAGHRRLSARHRANGSHHAGPDRRNIRRRRRIHRRPDGARGRRSRLSRPLRRRQHAGRAQRPRRDGRRGRAVGRAATGAGLSSAARLARPAVSGRVRRLHRLEFRLPVVAVDSAARPAGGARRLPALGPGGETVHHRSDGCTASSPSRRSTRGFRPSGRSRSTPSSPTWTPLRACTFRAAGCGRCPTRWPPPRRMPVSNSATVQPYRGWIGATTGSGPWTPTVASASTPTR